jgi:Flp pilus assembly protein TadG
VTSEHESQRGQASVELIATIPALVLLVGLAVQVALAGWSQWGAENAARAGARAAAVGGEARQAARSALPAGLPARSVVRSNGTVEVTVASPHLYGALPPVRSTAGAQIPGAGPGVP